MAKSTPRTRRSTAAAAADPEVLEQSQPAAAATAVESAPAPARKQPAASNDDARTEAPRKETRAPEPRATEVRESRGDSRGNDARDGHRPEKDGRDRDDRDDSSSSGSADVGVLDAETNAKYEQVKGGKLYIKDLQTMDIHGLHDIAKQEGIQDYIGLKKQDLIFQILRSRIRQNGLMYGEGVLEILPDGFGFLRSPEYNYLPCPDDIYISPSQIRRFGLRNGHVVQG